MNASLESLKLQKHNTLLFLLVLDSDGKVPSGIMSTIKDGCDLQMMLSGKSCDEQPFDYIKTLIKLPYGNTVSVGAIEECLAATSTDLGVFGGGAPFTSR